MAGHAFKKLRPSSGKFFLWGGVGALEGESYTLYARKDGRKKRASRWELLRLIKLERENTE